MIQKFTLYLVATLLLLNSFALDIKSEQKSSVRDIEVSCPSSNAKALEAYNLGTAYFNMGNTDSAKIALSQAIALDSEFCGAMENLGLLYRSLYKEDSAIYWYKRSIKINPISKVAYQNLGVAYYSIRQYDSAIASYLKVVKLDSLSPEGYYGIGLVLFSANNPEKAIPLLKHAAGLYATYNDPYVVRAEYLLGLSYFDKGSCDSSIMYLEDAFESFSNDTNLLYSLGYCYLSSKPVDSSKAKEYLTAAKKEGSKTAELLLQKLSK